MCRLLAILSPHPIFRRRRAAAAARRERAELVRHSWRERPPRGIGAAAWRALHDGAREKLLQVVASAFERHAALRAWACALDAPAAARLCEALAREWEMALRCTPTPTPTRTRTRARALTRTVTLTLTLTLNLSLALALALALTLTLTLTVTLTPTSTLTLALTWWGG